jgi:hypothetical protein
MLHAKNGEIDSDEEEYLEEDVKGSSKQNRKRSAGTLFIRGLSVPEKMSRITTRRNMAKYVD